MVAAWRPTEGMTAMPRPTMGPLSTERSASRLQHMCTVSFRKGGGLVDAPGRRVVGAQGRNPFVCPD